MLLSLSLSFPFRWLFTALYLFKFEIKGKGISTFVPMQLADTSNSSRRYINDIKMMHCGKEKGANCNFIPSNNALNLPHFPPSILHYGDRQFS